MDTTSKKQNLRVFWKLMNPQECAWEIRCRIIMKTILQAKVRIHYGTTIWFTILSYASSYENHGSKSSCGQGMGKLENISAWNLTKSEVRKRVDRMKQGRRALQFIFASLMDICQWKNAELNWRKKTKVELFSAVITLPQNIYAELIPAKKNCSCINTIIRKILKL